MNTENQPTDSQSLVIVPQVEQNLPSDAKNKAISDLTAACYQKASQLQLTKEEITALSADFPDEAFQPGAAGKENLIYIEHASLRERLDQVIGMGQWCVIPIRRWEEQFDYQKDEWANGRRTGNQITVKGSHVYVDGIMLIRGAFVGSAIGEMTYYPDNHTQNYGDAVEGAETAALRRCCKRLGIGLQAWRKDWCAGWWARRKPQRPPNTPRVPTEASKTPQDEPEVSFEGATAPKPENAPKAHAATPKHRLRALNNLQAAPGQSNAELFEVYLRSKGWITINQTSLEWPLEHVPATKEAMSKLSEDVVRFEISLREQHDDAVRENITK